MNIVFFLIFFIIFLIIFGLSLFFLHWNYISKKNMYLIIPILCFSFWVFHCIYFLNTIKYNQMGSLWDADFRVFYSAGKQVLQKPGNLYEIERYLYMPSFAIFFCFTFSLLPYEISFYLFYLFNWISGIFAILEFNKILILKDIQEKIHRFVFLIVISNGYLIWVIFYFNHFKFILFFLLLYIIRREIQYKKENREKNYQYYILNYGLLVFIIGMAPYFVFILLIYFFQEIPIKKLIYKKNLMQCLIVILWFIIQNITFILYPSQIMRFLEGFNRPSNEPRSAYPLYLKDFLELSKSKMRTIVYIFTGILILITIILIALKNKIEIENKFSLFFLAQLFFGVISYPYLIAYILFSFVLFLFVPFLKQDFQGFDFIKKNIFFFIGIFSVLGIFLLIDNFIITIFFPAFNDLDLGFFALYLILIFHIIMLIGLFSLFIKENFWKIEKFRLR